MSNVRKADRMTVAEDSKTLKARNLLVYDSRYLILFHDLLTALPPLPLKMNENRASSQYSRSRQTSISSMSSLSSMSSISSTTTSSTASSRCSGTSTSTGTGPIRNHRNRNYRPCYLPAADKFRLSQIDNPAEADAWWVAVQVPVRSRSPASSAASAAPSSAPSAPSSAAPSTPASTSSAPATSRFDPFDPKSALPTDGTPIKWEEYFIFGPLAQMLREEKYRKKLRGRFRPYKVVPRPDSREQRFHPYAGHRQTSSSSDASDASTSSTSSLGSA